MEMMKRLLKAKGLHQAVMFHDVRWGAEHEGRFLWVLLNSGSCGAYAFNHDPEHARGVHSYRQPSLYFPTPGGTFAGESLPGKMTWARAYIKDGVLWMDIGRGEVVKLPHDVRDAWWEGTTREWPFMAADMGISRDTLMAHYLSNHVAVAYGDVFGEMVALSQELGFRVRILGRRRCLTGRASTSASTSAPASVARGALRRRRQDARARRRADHALSPARGLRRAVVGRHLARGRGRRPRGARDGGREPRGDSRDRLRRDLLARRARRRRRAGEREPDRATTRRTSSSGWTTAPPSRPTRINATPHEVLRYVGGGVSPEMETPKLLWLKETAPRAWTRAKRFLDLPDFLVYRATGNDVRSLCTTVCKWTYLAHDGRDGTRSFFRSIGLGDLADEGFARIGTNVRPMGERAGMLTDEAARELGLVAGDAGRGRDHRRARGRPGPPRDRRSTGGAPARTSSDERLALIGGTSTCHMAVSREPRFIPGHLGPVLLGDGPGVVAHRGGPVGDGRAPRSRDLDARRRGRAPARGEREGDPRGDAPQRSASTRSRPKRESPSPPPSRATSTCCPITTATARRAPTRRCAAWSRASS